MNQRRGPPGGPPWMFQPFLQMQGGNRAAALDMLPVPPPVILNNMQMNNVPADLLERFRGLRNPPNVQLLKLDVSVDNVVCYNHERGTTFGVHRFNEKVLSRQVPDNYFEIEIVNLVKNGHCVVGLVAVNASQGAVGVVEKSIGLSLTSGVLMQNGMERRYGPVLRAGDRLGIKLDFDPRHPPTKDAIEVIFMHNGARLDSQEVFLPDASYVPTVTMACFGESLKFCFDNVRPPESASLETMECDHLEEAWERLHDVRLNGDTIEYTGAGVSHTDVGFAQAAKPLSPSCHYFELEILDPGDNAYIAIGVAHKNYSEKNHPGWSKGSIAYHADDGEIFVEHAENVSGAPVCKRGDRMGCGILFPSNYEEARLAAFEQPPVDQPPPVKKPVTARKLARNRRGDNQRYLRQRQLARELWAMPRLEIDDYVPHEQLDCGISVKVFFTKNGHIVATKEMPLPLEGFYPTIGLLSRGEKVRVDLQPLSG